MSTAELATLSEQQMFTQYRQTLKFLKISRFWPSTAIESIPEMVVETPGTLMA
jgi:hypothetical protein